MTLKILHKMFCCVYTNHCPSSLKHPEYLNTWIYLLTVNMAYDFLRKRKRTKEIRMADVLEDILENAVACASVQNLRSELEFSRLRSETAHLLGRISPQDRKLLILREFEGLTLKELGHHLDCDQNAAGVKLFRARQRAQRAYYESLRESDSAMQTARIESQGNAVRV